MARRPRQLKKQLCYLYTNAGYIDYALYRSSRRRSLQIFVEDTGEVRVYVPSYVSEKEIHSFIRDKASWIDEKVKEMKEMNAVMEKRQFREGAEFLFLGKKYKIEVTENNVRRSRIGFDGFKWIIQVPSGLNDKERQREIRERIVKWFRREAKEVLGGRIFHYARLMGVEPMNIVIKTQKRIWGSCDHGKKVISLNWQIIMSPLAVIDYVVVHELCHLRVPDHSKRFWREVQKVLPQYARQKTWLRKHSLDMTLPE